MVSTHSRRRFRDIAALVDLADEESEVTATTSLVQRTTTNTTTTPFSIGPQHHATTKQISFADQLRNQKTYIQQQQSIEEEDDEDEFDDSFETPHLSAHLLQQHYSHEDDDSSSSGSNSFEAYSSADLSMEAEAGKFWGGSTRFHQNNIAEEPTTSLFTSRFHDKLRSRFSPQTQQQQQSPKKPEDLSIRDLVLNSTDSTDSCTLSSHTSPSHRSMDHSASVDCHNSSNSTNCDSLPTSPLHEEKKVPSWKMKQRLKMRERMGLLEEEEVSTPQRLEEEEDMNIVTPLSPIEPVEFEPLDSPESPPALARTRSWRSKEFRRTFEHKANRKMTASESDDDDEEDVPIISEDEEEEVVEDCNDDESHVENEEGSVAQSPVKRLRDLFESPNRQENDDNDGNNSASSKAYMNDPSLHEQRRKNHKVLPIRSLTKATPIAESECGFENENSECGIENEESECDDENDSESVVSSAAASSSVESQPLAPPADWWQDMEAKVDRYHRAVRTKSAGSDLRLDFEEFCSNQNQLGRAMAVALFHGMEVGRDELQQSHEEEIQALQDKHEQELQELREQLAAKNTAGNSATNTNNASRNEAFRQRWKSRMNSNRQPTEVASTVVSNMSCRELSVQRYRDRILAQMNKGRTSAPSVVSHGDNASEVSLTPTTNSEKQNKQNAQEIQRLLDELQQAERRQKLLEKQLHQAGVVLAEDIPYQLAKDKVAAISKRMNEIGSSDVVHDDPLVQKQLREEYFRLEKDMEKYLSALMLTDEFAQEQRLAAEAWEAKHASANQAALDAIRKHMPLDIRTLSAQQLEEDRGLPKAMVQKFRRSNVLQLLRVDPAMIGKWHPSTLEAFRVTGLTLTERRAIHAYLLPVAKAWRGSTEGLTARADPMTTRKLAWYDTMRTNFKEALERYERHLGGTNGTPRRHIQSTCLCNRCNLIGNQCPVRANKALDYFATDLGFPYQEGDQLYEDAKVVATNKVDQKSPAEIIAEARGQPQENHVFEASTPIRPKPKALKPKTPSPKPSSNNRPRHPLMAKGPAKPSGLLAAIAARRID